VFQCPFWAQARATHLSSVISEIDALCANSTLVFDHNCLSWFLVRGLSHGMPPPPPNPADLAISGDDGDAANGDASSLAGADSNDGLIESGDTTNGNTANSNAPSLAGSDSNNGLIESGASTDSVLPLGNSCGSLAAARFLTVIARLRAVTIQSRWGQFQLKAGSRGVPIFTTGQRPNG
jgi:hypothetical protein